MDTERFSRQILAFGLEGQQRIAATHVGVAGLGGLGLPLVQSLAYLGVVRFTLVDDDRLVKTNLNRSVGGGPADVICAAPKVHVATRMIMAIAPEAVVKPMDANLR